MTRNQFLAVLFVVGALAGLGAPAAFAGCSTSCTTSRGQTEICTTCCRTCINLKGEVTYSNCDTRCVSM